MNRAPAFQFYPDDWLSSPKISTMTSAEEGAYIRLLSYSWNDPDCTIPDDDTSLAVLSRLGEGWLNGSGNKLRACFVPHPKKIGRLFNVRLMKERKKQEDWRKKSQQGGKRSAESRASRASERSRVVEGCLNGGSTLVEPKGNSSSSPPSSRKNKKEIESSLSSGNPKASPLPPSKRKAVKIPMPDGFEISDELRTWATARGFTADLVEREFEKFCERNKAKGETYADWNAAFRSWLIRSPEFAPSSTGRPAHLVNGTYRVQRERIPL